MSTARNPQQPFLARWQQVFPLIFLIAYAISLVWWLAVDTRPVAWDESVHLKLAYNWLQLFTGHEHEAVTSPVYPPLYHLTLVPLLWLAQVWHLDWTDTALLTHVFYLALLFWSLMALSRGLIGDAWPGLISAALISAMPVTIWSAHRALIDFALVAWICAGMEWLRRCQGFTIRRESLIFGVWSGLGLLLKPFYAVWLLGPVLLSLYESRHPGKQRRHIGLTLCATLTVCLPYYGYQGLAFFKNATQLVSTQGAMEGDPGFQTLAGWWYYPRQLLDQCGFVLLPIMIAGVLWTLKHRQLLPRGSILFMLTWCVTGYVLFTLNHNKDIRYTLPLLPPLCLLAFWGLSQLRSTHLLVASMVVLVGASIQQFRSEAPVHEDWQHASLTQLLTIANQSKPVRVSVLSNHPYFFDRGIAWSALQKGLRLERVAMDDAYTNFSQFVITKSGDLGPFSTSQANQQSELLARGPAFTAVYNRIAQLALPDNSIANVYKRNDVVRYDIPGISTQHVANRISSALESLIHGTVKILIDTDPHQLDTGYFKTITLSGGPWMINGIPIQKATIRLDGVRLNLYQLWNHQHIEITDLQNITPDIQISEQVITSSLQMKLGREAMAQAWFSENKLHVRAFRHIWLGADINLVLVANEQRLVAELNTVYLGNLSIPGWLLGNRHRALVQLDRLNKVPNSINVSLLHTRDGILRIDWLLCKTDSIVALMAKRHTRYCSTADWSCQCRNRCSVACNVCSESRDFTNAAATCDAISALTSDAL